MRVGILSYPMLFQHDSCMQMQLGETVAALNALPGGGVTAELLDPARTRLDNYDLVHVFSAAHGNHRMVETAVEQQVPVLLSPMVSCDWDRANGVRARVGDRLLGKLTDWNVQTSYAHTRRALQLANMIVAQGESECRAIVSGFLVPPHRVRVLPIGISSRFFDADGALFRALRGIDVPFVLCAGPVSPYRDQIGLADTLAALGVPLVVIGSAIERDAAYFDQLRHMPGTICLGDLSYADPLLASAFAAASVFALMGQGDESHRSVLAALAAGTPVVSTSDCVQLLPQGQRAFHKIAKHDGGALGRIVMQLLAAPVARAEVKALVRTCAWSRVAQQLVTCYAQCVLPDARERQHAV